MELENYVKQNLPTALNAIIQTEKMYELPNLSVYEKAIIFAYTDARNNLHQILNEQLWESQGRDITDFGVFLEGVLDKLEPYNKLMVFRGAQTSYCDVERYIRAYENNTIVTEYNFLSASKFQIIAQGFRRILFKIYGKYGRNIEKLSKFGKESEVVFKRNSAFRVLKVTNSGFSTIITLKEI